MKYDTGTLNGVSTATITGSDINGLVNECMPFIRAKSKEFYKRQLKSDLSERGESIIDQHAGSGTFYIVKLMVK